MRQNRREDRRGKATGEGEERRGEERLTMSSGGELMIRCAVRTERCEGYRGGPCGSDRVLCLVRL